jgi:hypothetical protein
VHRKSAAFVPPRWSVLDRFDLVSQMGVRLALDTASRSPGSSVNERAASAEGNATATTTSLGSSTVRYSQWR